MAKTKYDFIKELLENKKINQRHRERILELTSKEISIEGTLEERVQKIEEIIFKEKMENDIEIIGMKPSKQKPNQLPKYFNPYHLYKFLFEYNQNQILRTTCHDIDANELKSILEFCKTESYIFNEHLKSIVNAYEEHEKAYSAPFQVKALIRGYLTGKNSKGEIIAWSSKNIKINWSSSYINDWTSQNPNTPPNLNEVSAGNQEIELLEINPQIISAITENSIQNFTQLVLHFKNLFHLKSGPQSLKEIIKRVNSEKRWNEKVDFEIENAEFTNNLEHFTDVEKLIQAYNKFVEIVIEQHKRNDKPKVKLRYYEKNQQVLFSIHHLNGVYNKTIENTIDRLGQSYTSLIKNQINGLCNLRLKADFDNDKYAELNLWDGNNRISTEIHTFQGVEHILEFPKIFKL
jgi:hypothetical protein